MRSRPERRTSAEVRVRSGSKSLTIYPLGYSGPMPCPFTALLTWSARRWIVAAVTAIATFAFFTLTTSLVANPVFGRSVPPTEWAMNVTIITAVLTGLLTATYVQAPDSAKVRTGGAGALLAYLAVGCPVCNKLALLALGTSGALTYFAPIQPYLAAAGIALLGWALIVRLNGESSCAWSPQQ